MKEKKPNKLKVYCVENGISGKELAEMLGIKPVTVYQYFSGARKPGYEVIKKMVKLGINLNEIFFNKKELHDED